VTAPRPLLLPLAEGILEACSGWSLSSWSVEYRAGQAPVVRANYRFVGFLTAASRIKH
jgi:hypothetical protein